MVRQSVVEQLKCYDTHPYCLAPLLIPIVYLPYKHNSSLGVFLELFFLTRLDLKTTLNYRQQNQANFKILLV